MFDLRKVLLISGLGLFALSIDCYAADNLDKFKKMTALQIDELVDKMEVTETDCSMNPLNTMKARLTELSASGSISYERYLESVKKINVQMNLCRKAFRAHQFERK